MLNIFGKGTSQAKKRCSFICKKIVVSPVPDNSFLKGVFFQFAIFFLFLILQKHVLGVTNLSPPIHQSINILVVFLVSQNIPFLFCKKNVVANASPSIHQSSVFLQFVCSFFTICHLFSLFLFCKKNVVRNVSPPIHQSSRCRCHRCNCPHRELAPPFSHLRTNAN